MYALDFPCYKIDPLPWTKDVLLQEACLDMSTAHQLMSASRHVGWGKLEGALGKISTNTFRLYGQPCCVSKCAEAAEAASFLGWWYYPEHMSFIASNHQF